MGYQKDRNKADGFMPTVLAILGQHFIEPAAIVEDRDHNTDLVVTASSGSRIACRLRAPSYQSEYAEEFTIRYCRPSGMKTEYEKIREGWGDLLFYGFWGSQPPILTKWFIGDLGVFRRWDAEYRARNSDKRPGREINNRDGSSSFLVFLLADMPLDFVIAKSVDGFEYGPLERQLAPSPTATSQIIVANSAATMAPNAMRL